jgi:hypothetical protein
MSDHTFDGRSRESAAEGATAGQALQPEHAFVVQLRGGLVTSPRALQGRVEHVISGEVLRFFSTEELIEFLMQGGPPAPRRSTK